MKLTTIICALVFSVLSTFPTFAAWQLDNANSTLSFISIKKGDIAEVHHFKHLEGLLKDEEISLTVDLASVDTKIGIRDQRMKEHLFKTSTFSQATFNTQLNEKVLANIKVGTTDTLTLKGHISLHGQKQAVSVDVLIAKLSEKKVVVSALKPLVINAKAYGLVDGIAKLQALAGLPSISKAVPVSFVLSFNKA